MRRASLPVRNVTLLTESPESGAQPLTNADESIVLAVNGEIYNHRLIRKNLKKPYHFKTTSDCEVIIPLVRTNPDALYAMQHTGYG